MGNPNEIGDRIREVADQTEPGLAGYEEPAPLTKEERRRKEAEQKASSQRRFIREVRPELQKFYELASREATDRTVKFQAKYWEEKGLIFSKKRKKTELRSGWVVSKEPIKVKDNRYTHFHETKIVHMGLLLGRDGKLYKGRGDVHEGWVCEQYELGDDTTDPYSYLRQDKWQWQDIIIEDSVASIKRVDAMRKLERNLPEGIGELIGKLDLDW